MDDILIKIIDVVSKCLKVNKNTLNLDSDIKIQIIGIHWHTF